VTPGELAVVASRGVVAGVLAAAAIAKLRDQRGTRDALRAAGMPEGLARTLPVVEGFTAFGLVMEQHSGWAALVACVLLGAFTVYLVITAVRGAAAPCACFGAPVRAAAPAGSGGEPWRAVVRNLVLVALAVIATGPPWWLAWPVAIATAVAILARASPARAPRA